ncbi:MULTISPECIES: ABC transporter permease [Roseiflexus]|jgi:ABC-2 type transport system permease protein|uniref:Transport permease protein n=1 Tax=Roseiflexus castenholzii (strain DSM 13941 / HLO8) TaxID=383372 RepID=A7NK38_ROSCS|nr:MULTISPECIES: ABC transporter permease [Roseiflexus]ABU57858.1 ABC-2 type transporter [Roseiflexus castenholzii DSM 13941]GIW00754.1 MAG: transport permease protein [Roseiflexus sp.]
MFSRLWPVMRKEFIHIRRDPRTLVVMFIAPLMQLILLGYAATTDVRDVPLAVFDQDRTSASRDLVEAFVASGQFAVAHYTGSDRELAALIDGGRARAGLIIPPGYAADVQGRRGAQVVFVLDGSDPSIAGSSLSAARLIGQAKSVSIQTERRGATAPLLEVRTRVWYNPDMASAVFMIPGLIGLVLQLQATLLTSSAIVRERERGTIEQLIITPIRSFELILGKILPYALVALLITLEVLILGTFWFGVPIKGDVGLLLAISCLFLLSTLSIGLLISTVANTQQEAFLLTFLTLLPSVFLSGFIYPVAAMPAALQFISGIIPLTYYLIVVRGIVIKGVDASTLLPQIGALALFGAILIVAATARFRKRLD